MVEKKTGVYFFRMCAVLALYGGRLRLHPTAAVDLLVVSAIVDLLIVVAVSSLFTAAADPKDA